MDELGNLRPKVAWPWLYAIVAAMIGLLAAVETVVPDGALRRTLECVVTLVMFVAMATWVRVNRVAIAVAEGDDGAPRPSLAIASSRTPRHAARGR
jgi:hypothetical protein